MQQNGLDIEKLYNTYAKKLYFISLRITADRFDAEEAMHDTFLRLYRLPDKEQIKKIENWLTSVCIRISIDKLRKKKSEALFRQEIAAETTEEKCSGEEITNGKEPPQYSVDSIKKALHLLPDGYRLIISLHLFEGYDYEEIAHITGLQESSVRSQYMRAKKRLAELAQQIPEQGDLKAKSN